MAHSLVKKSVDYHSDLNRNLVCDKYTSNKRMAQAEWSACQDRIVNEARRSGNLGTGNAIDSVLAECGFEPEPETITQQHKTILLEACKTLEYDAFPQVYRGTFDPYDPNGAYIREIRGECSKIFARSVQGAPPNLQAARTPPKRPPVVWSMDRATATEVRAVKEAVGLRLKDPYSARYENIYALQGSNGYRNFCGTVNAKNSMGGYTGRTAFYVRDFAVRFSDDSVLGMMVPLLCQPRTVE